MAPAAERSRAPAPVASGKSPTWARFRTMLWSRTGETSAIDQLLARARTGQGDGLVTAGLPEWVIARLGRGEASALLAERSGAPLPAAVRDALLAAAAGNPLALIELPRTLSPAQLAGTEPLPEPLPLGGELERVFAARVRQLEPGQRTLALLCACSGRLPAITRAAAELGVDPAGLDRLEGLASVEAPAVRFAHPLVRSAVYY